MERLRRHFVKSCPKNPFHKDSKEYEELLESVNAPQQESKKKSFAPSGKTKSNRIITYSIGFVSSILSGPLLDLSAEQIQRLEAQGNRSSNWSSVKFIGSPTMSYDSTIDRIRNCHFSGTILLGFFLKPVALEHNISVPSGLYNSNFSGTCIFSDNCYVWNTSMLSNVFLGRNSSIVNCGSVTCDGPTSYGTQRIVSLGAESDAPGSTHSRSIVLNVNLSYAEVCSRIMNPRRADNADLLLGETAGASSVAANNNMQLGVKKYARSNRSDDYVRYELSIICDDVEVSHCPTICNAFVGSYCKVMHSTLFNSTSLSHCSIVASEVTDSVLHGFSSITSRSIVHGVLMFPHSHVSEGAKVSESVLGPDAAVGTGEVKRSLLGPFVGFHHAGLLIASLWPLGRGNIGYGAMLGANHTSRTNDQECLPGEGCFFGLACAIRFPFSLLQSPYSIVAANTVCQPQRISFPFSLISTGDAGTTSLRPAWVLWANPYFLERSISKFSKRRKCLEYRSDFPVFRPAVVDKVLNARQRLLALKQLADSADDEDASKMVLHGAQVTTLGGGQCTIRVKDIDTALDAYTCFLHRYALYGLLYMVITGDNVPSTSPSSHTNGSNGGNGATALNNATSTSNPLDAASSASTTAVNASSAFLQTSAVLAAAAQDSMMLGPDHADSDSEDEEGSHHLSRNQLALQQQSLQSQQISLPPLHPPQTTSSSSSSQPGQSSSLDFASPLAFLFDDLRRMESGGTALEETLLRTKESTNSLLPPIRLQTNQQQHQHQHMQQMHHQMQQQHAMQFQQHQQQQMLLGQNMSPMPSQQMLPSPHVASHVHQQQLQMNAIGAQQHQLMQHQQLNHLLQQPPVSSQLNASGMGHSLQQMQQLVQPQMLNHQHHQLPQSQHPLPSLHQLQQQQQPQQQQQSPLIGRGGHCLVLTDSHDIAVRQHQLHLLCELFPDAEAARFLEAVSRLHTAQMQHAAPAPSVTATVQQLGAGIQQLLLRLVDLERFNAEQVQAARRKDAVRAVEIIAGSADRSQDTDDVVSRARNRSEDIAALVQRVTAHF